MGHSGLFIISLLAPKREIILRIFDDNFTFHSENNKAVRANAMKMRFQNF